MDLTSRRRTSRSFYTKTLLFVTNTDQPMGDDPDAQRWIELRIPGAETGLVLFTSEEHRDRVGTFIHVTLCADDVRATYEQYTARAVEFTGPPQEKPWGTLALMKDPDSNVLCISSR